MRISNRPTFCRFGIQVEQRPCTDSPRNVSEADEDALGRKVAEGCADSEGMTVGESHAIAGSGRYGGCSAEEKSVGIRFIHV